MKHEEYTDEELKERERRVWAEIKRMMKDPNRHYYEDEVMRPNRKERRRQKAMRRHEQ